MRQHISNRLVASLGTGCGTVIWDRRLAGFGVRAYPSGSRVYVAQAKGPGGMKRVTLGRHGLIDAAEARAAAAVAIGRIVAGEEVSAHRHRGPTVAEAARRYLRRHVAAHCKPGTLRMRESVIHGHLLPALGGRPLAGLRTADVAEMHRRMADTPAQANAAVSTLSAIVAKHRQWGLIPENGPDPCADVVKYRNRRRERFLSGAEYARLGRALDDSAGIAGVSQTAAAAVRLLMLTGCRRNEILSLRWDDVDLGARELRLRDAKTGPRTVPLAPAAVDVLAGQSCLDSVWVFPGQKPGTHYKDLWPAWALLRKRARLDDVRLHDLRHSFASCALALGESLPMIAKLLGHRRIESTARYAHLSRGDVREAAARVADELAKDVLPGWQRRDVYDRRGNGGCNEGG